MNYSLLTLTRAGLTILLIALSLTTANAKSDIIAKGITFSGEIVKHEPNGYGTLTMISEPRGDVKIEVTGTFNGNTISQGKIVYFNGSDVYRLLEGEKTNYTIEDIKDLRGIDKKINTIEGDFTFSHDKKWEKIVIEAPSVTILGVKGLNLGAITINKGCRKFSSFTSIDFDITGNSGEVFLPLQKPMYHEQMNMLGLDTTNYLTNYDFTVGEKYSLVNLHFYRSVFKFSDGSILEVPKNVLKVPSGDYIEFYYDKYNNVLKEFTIIDKEGNIYKGKDVYWIREDGRVELTIAYLDGSKFTGEVKTSISGGPGGLDIYKKLKSCPASSIQYYTGTFTDAKGETIEYIEGETKAGRDARLLAEAKAKEEAKAAAQKKDEQEKVAEHNARVKKYGKTFAEAIENDNIMVGMTTEMLKEMTLVWSLYYDGGSKKIYIGEQNMLADAFIRSFGGRSKRAFVTVVNNKVKSVVYK